MQNINSQSWYSIIASIMMIGFLLILTTSTLNLVLQEMQDGKGRQDYLKAFAGAEWGLELALLKIKENGYGYDEDNFSWALLWDTPKDAQIWYTFESRVDSFSWTISSFETVIIPLFYVDTWSSVYSSSEISLNTALPGIAWNIIGNGVGISWVGDFNATTSVWIKDTASFDDTGNLRDFLSSNSGSYLSLYNTSLSDINYTLMGSWLNPSFTQPSAQIYSQARVGKYVQNLETTVNNTEFLWILKYSIFSWN